MCVCVCVILSPAIVTHMTHHTYTRERVEGAVLEVFFERFVCPALLAPVENQVCGHTHTLMRTHTHARIHFRIYIRIYV